MRLLGWVLVRLPHLLPPLPSTISCHIQCPPHRRQIDDHNFSYCAADIDSKGRGEKGSEKETERERDRERVWGWEAISAGATTDCMQRRKVCERLSKQNPK